jgi:hypothetical protein
MIKTQTRRRPLIPVLVTGTPPSHNVMLNTKATNCLNKLLIMSGLGSGPGVRCAPVFFEKAASLVQGRQQRIEILEYAPTLHAVARDLVKRQMQQHGGGVVRAKQRPAAEALVRPQARFLAGQQETYWLCFVHTPLIVVVTFFSASDLNEWKIECPPEPSNLTLDTLPLLLVEAERLDREILGPRWTADKLIIASESPREKE